MEKDTDKQVITVHAVMTGVDRVQEHVGRIINLKQGVSKNASWRKDMAKRYNMV